MKARCRTGTTFKAGLLAVLLIVAVAPAVGGVSAQEDTPTIVNAEDLGLPEIVITATDEGWDAPGELAAGRYLVTVTYEGDRPYGTTAFALLPDDWTIDDFNARLSGGSQPDGDEATPSSDVSSTVSEPDISWIYELTLAGGVSPTPGATAQGIVDLTAGNWAIWADDFSPEAIPLTVTGEVPAVQSIPESDVTITGVSDDGVFAFQVDGTISSDLQIIEIINESSQPMFIEFLKLSSAVSAEQLKGFLITPSGLAPDPALALPDDFGYEVTPFYSAIQSDGVRQWLVTSFEPGAFGMVCWLPDPEHGNASHASQGMIATFEVS
ncbi:MAG: hypothetical protein AB7V46_11305 [Thermomicrobiales bacterium]